MKIRRERAGEKERERGVGEVACSRRSLKVGYRTEMGNITRIDMSALILHVCPAAIPPRKKNLGSETRCPRALVLCPRVIATLQVKSHAWGRHDAGIHKAGPGLAGLLDRHLSIHKKLCEYAGYGLISEGSVREGGKGLVG